MEKVDFELKKNHLILAEKEILIGCNRICYDPDNIKIVADALNIEPDKDGSYSNEQQLFCEKLIVEMPLALKLIDQQRSEPGIYSIDKDFAYAEYIANRNYSYLKPLFMSIATAKKIHVPVILFTLASTTHCEEDNRDLILREFYDRIKEKCENESIPWSGLFIQEIEKQISIPKMNEQRQKHGSCQSFGKYGIRYQWKHTLLKKLSIGFKKTKKKYLWEQNLNISMALIILKMVVMDIVKLKIQSDI